MGIQFGHWNFDGNPVPEAYLDRVEAILAPYVLDEALQRATSKNCALLSGSLLTPGTPAKKTSPQMNTNGLITWDGRLDNSNQLRDELRDFADVDPADESVVSAALCRWEQKTFSKLVGDWALATWNPEERHVLLAKDFLGARQLYYSVDHRHASWCTVLDPLVLLRGQSIQLEEEYLAGWMSQFPAPQLTPYAGIHAVPPGCYVEIHPHKQLVHRYWNFNPGNRIRYRSDPEYESHFRSVFSEAVRRRLRSNSPVLAELSGGMDSTSVVCMADQLIREGKTDVPSLETLSYFDDNQPNWNERPYFTIVERLRGKTGSHIDVSSSHIFDFAFGDHRFPATPGHASLGMEPGEQFRNCLRKNNHRVLLSGIGGDEVAGGVPTPTPELADLAAEMRFARLFAQLKAWAIHKRKPVFHLVAETISGFLPQDMFPSAPKPGVASWLRPEFVRRNRAALLGYPTRLKLLGALPSFQENLIALDALRRQVASWPTPGEPYFEKTYPYLDRDFLEFIYAVPRDQLARPGERRSLMRRALNGIVPPEILHRKRKAFLSRVPIPRPADGDGLVTPSNATMTVCSLNFVDPNALADVLRLAREGREFPMLALKRTLLIEKWRRELRRWNVFDGANLPPAVDANCRSLATQESRAVTLHP
jgi:asparagine synthase (glutamine-hydrolysing)